MDTTTRIFSIGARIRVTKADDRHTGQIGVVRSVDDRFVKVGDLPDEGDIVRRIGRTYYRRHVALEGAGQ